MKLSGLMVCLPVLFVVGCAASPQDVNADRKDAFQQGVKLWEGHSEDELLLAWGLADKEADLEAGRKLLQYETSIDVPLGDSQYRRQDCRVSVILAEDKTVSAVRGQGNGCLADPHMQETFPRP